MDRRDLLKLLAISPIARALKAGKVTAAPTSTLESTAVGRKDFEKLGLSSTETEILQFREGEIRAFEVPDCTSMTLYAEKENKGDIYFGAEKDPAIDGLCLQPGRQFVAGDVPAAHLYAVGSHDDLMIVTWVNITKK